MFCIMAAGAVSCNEKSEETPDENLYTESVAVNAFSLQANAKVLSRLDSVFFSIDLEHGVIFNADSLPMGTNVRALVATISYPSTVNSATIEMEGGNHRTGSFSYSDNPTDTIDFTGKVSLKLTTAGGLEKTYRLKVNVHKMKPDSLIWDKVEVSSLPSRFSSPVAQKSIIWNSGFLSICEETDGTYTRAFTENPAHPTWEKQHVSFGFPPRLRTLTAVGSKLYMLAADGRLMTSDDALRWTDTGTVWDNIIGAFNDSLLGLRTSDGHTYHTQWPAATETEIPSGFPVEGFSNPGVFSSEWSPEPTFFIVGGKDSNGNTISATWAYDGSVWAEISNRPLSACSDVTLIPYFSFRESTSGTWTSTRYSIWIALGGRNADNTLRDKVYISYDNGVNWEEGSQLLQLPAFIPALYQADALVFDVDKNYDLDNAWKKVTSPKLRGAKPEYTINGTDVSWKCPYIYLSGGYDKNAVLNDKIFRAVIARLTFHPIF